MNNFFLEDCKKHGIYDDFNIFLKVDPGKWSRASIVKRWYILYHELGHDVLNFEHGEGGKMMFNFTEEDYSWEVFLTIEIQCLN